MIRELFLRHDRELHRVRTLAEKVRDGIRAFAPFLEQHTSVVCPACRDVCCEDRHAVYDREDLVYIFALGLMPHEYEQREERAPCRFLGADGCRRERSLRPSRCNWYFCDELYESIEKASGAAAFNNTLYSVAELWMEMVEEFTAVTGNELWRREEREP